MATSYYPQDEIWEEEYWLDNGYEDGYYENGRPRLPQEFLVIFLAITIAFVLAAGAIRFIHFSGGPAVSQPPREESKPVDIPAQPAAPPLLTSPDTFIAPYDIYILTQGVHGLSYGHMAIDLAAGKGEPILSPITGAVTERFTDGIGNPVLVIENERYQVTMLHGAYSVNVGDQLTAGFQVGTESNQGNTFDMAGNSCRGRDCGYHTHLNVFDKQLNSNINPLDLLNN